MDVKKEVELTPYFSQHLTSAEYRPLLVRVTNALVRSGITTMDDLCERSDEQLMRVRNFGVKCFETSVLMREMYIAENGKECR